jgi:uncharacterized protein YutD
MYKKSLALTLILSFIAFVSGCDKIGLPKFKSKEKTKSTSSKTTSKTSDKSKKTSTTTDSKKTTSNNKKSSKPGMIESLSNYGTGYTQLNIKKNKTKQIKDIQKKYNERVNNAIH